MDRLISPTCLAFDGSGRLHVADSHWHNVFVLDRDERWTPVFTSMTAQDPRTPELQPVRSMAAAPGGGLYIAETYGYRIWRWRERFQAEIIAGNGEEGFTDDGEDILHGKIGAVPSIAVDASGQVIFFDASRLLLRRLTGSGSAQTLGGNRRMEPTPDGLPLDRTALAEITGLAFDARGRLVFCDRSLDVVRVVDERGVVASLWDDPALGALRGPTQIAGDRAGQLFVLDRGNRRVLRVDTRGERATASCVLDARAQGGNDAAIDICSIAVDAEGALFCADAPGGQILKLQPDGSMTALPSALRAS
jgi:hypothetical protein